MKKLQRSFVLALVGLGVFPAWRSMAAVSFVLTDNDATPTSTTVTRGGTVAVSVKLLSTTTSDNAAGTIYQLQAVGPASGVFTLTSRDPGTGSNPFNDFTNSNGTVLDNTAAKGFPARLNPSNGTDPGSGDLGGLLQTVNTPINNNDPGGTATGANYNPALVANFTLAVDPNTPIGTYTLSVLSSTYSTFSPSTQTFSDGPVSAPPAASSLQNSFTITVVPEPASGLLIAMGVSALGLRRRRR